MSVSAVISNIARGSLHDGPGIRTVVYFKGCGLRCRWCHNPETLSTEKDILYAKIKCIHCGRCVDLCPEHHIIQGNDMVFLREGCIHCGRCADACPSGALSESGQQMKLTEVLCEIRKDIHYFRQNGGVTLSGGECLLQADFARAVLAACRADGIHTAIETALFVPWQQVEKVIPFCDLVYADCKIPDSHKHREFVGQDNGLILENLVKLVRSMPGKVIVRIPLIPGVNDAAEDIRAFADVLGPIAGKLQGIEVLRYNALAKSKYTLAGKAYTDFGQPQTDEVMLRYCADLQNALDNQTTVFTVL